MRLLPFSRCLRKYIHLDDLDGNTFTWMTWERKEPGNEVDDLDGNFDTLSHDAITFFTKCMLVRTSVAVLLSKQLDAKCAIPYL